MPTSPTWRPCLPLVITVLMCLNLPTKVSPPTWTGGSPSCNGPLLVDPFLPPSNCLTLVHSLMQALALELPSSSWAGGEPGGSSQDGKPCIYNEISDGQKLLALNVWYTTSMTLAMLEGTLPSTETTREWLRVGGMVEVTTVLSTKSVNKVFQWIHSIIGIVNPHVSFHTVYIPSGSKPVDGPSRGVYPPISQLILLLN